MLKSKILKAKVTMINRYLNLLLRDRGIVYPTDIFRAVSPAMRKEVEIVDRGTVILDDYSGMDELEFVRICEGAA